MTGVQIGPLGLPAIYLDNGKRVTTHSMLKSFLRCPKQAQYKYAERLKKRMLTTRDKPLRRGTWFHELLEVHYEGGDWKERHRELTAKFSMLMDEEKEALGDLPTELYDLMRSYLWHYGANKADPTHGWKILGTEVTFETPWPDSEDGNDIYRCRVDMLAEDQWGLIIVDHKSHKTLPGHTTRMLDAASPLYIWAARANGHPVRSFIWNYVRTKVPSKPEMVYVGTKRERLSTRAIDTDYPTFARAIKELKAKGHDIPREQYIEKARYLKSQRWEPGKPNTSPFFDRVELDKDDDQIARVVASAMRTRDRMHSDYDDLEVVERVSDRSCTFMCDFNELCETELFGGNADFLRRKQFRVGDPLDYYHDKKETESD